ncbi:MAG: MBL fold metallo-hydrolase [Cyclobacteriaceae bacterium]
MYIEQLYTGCLAEAAYYIESQGEAAVIDPLRETAPYLELAKKRGATIKYIFETHFHADFVSGHLDLAKATGATIVFGPNAQPNYSAYIAEDNEVFQLGEIQLKVLHTPGHTLESSCYLLRDASGRNYAVFTGDTLFNGDVGRPDLAVKSDLTAEDLAELLYHSIHHKLKPLADEVILYPAHGAGSQCGKNMNQETFSTIGAQKQFNYALQLTGKEKFVAAVLDGQEDPPAYFPENARINQSGYENIDAVMERNTQPLSVAAFEQAVAEGATILDTRQPDVFEQGFVPGSLNIGLNGQYAVWVGTLLKIDQPLVLVTDPGKEQEAIMRLARVGFEHVKGYLEGGITRWENAGKRVERVASVEGREVADLREKGYQVLDVRRNTEAETEQVQDSLNIPLKDLSATLPRLDPSQSYLVHCAGGYRSMIASSILKQHGINNFKNIHGGFQAMKEADNLPLVTGQCPTQRREEKLARLKV